MTCTGKLVPDVISVEDSEKVPEEIRFKLERYIETVSETKTALSAAWQVKEGDYEQKISDQEREISRLIRENEIESEKHKVTQSALKEAEARIGGLKDDVAALRESVKRLDAEGVDLRSQRDAALQENTRLRGTLSLNEVEIKSLQEKCRNLHSELQQATTAKYEAIAKYQGVKDLEASLQTREGEMEQKVQSLYKQIQDLKDDLNKHQDDLCTARREYIKKLMTIEAQLTAKTEECATQKNTIEDLRASLECSREKIEKLMAKLEEQHKLEVKMKESFNQELEAMNKLVQAYKNSSSVAEMNYGEVKEGTRQLNDLLKESTDSYSSLEEKFAQTEAAYKKQLSERDSRINSLEQELSAAENLLSDLKKGDMSMVLDSISPEASAACSMLRTCGSITQFYTRFVKVSEELSAVKEENRQLKHGLNDIAEKLNEKTPILKKQKEDYERAMATILQQSEQMDALNEEMVRVREEEAGLKKQLSHHQQEGVRLRTQVADLAKQVCHLLREVEHARAGRSTNGWNISTVGKNSSEVISHNLVVFGDIEELQAQNQKLLVLVREMSAKEEKAEEMEKDEVPLKEKVQFYEVQFKEMKDAAEGHKKLIDILKRQRDMYRTMYEQEVRVAPASADPPQESVQAEPAVEELKKKLAETEDQLKKLQDETDSYHKERQINDKMTTEQIQKLTADLDKANDEVSKLSGKLTKYEERFKLQESGLRTYKQQISALEGKSLLLSNTLKKHEETAMYFRNKALQSEGKVASLEVQLERVKQDHSLLVGKESRLRGEHETLRKEHDKVSRYLENLDAIRSSFERQETEATLKLQSLLEDSNRECAALRRRMQELEQQFKEERATLLQETELAKTRVDEEKKVSASIREELEAARNSCEKKVLEIEELNKKLTEARMSPLVLKNPSEADNFKLRVKELEAQLRQGQDEVEALRKHLTEAKEQGTTFRDMSEQFEKQWKEVTNKYNSLKEQHDKQLSEAKKLEADMRGKLKELTDRVAKMTAGSNKSTAQLSSQLATAQEQLQKVQAERNTLKQELEVSDKKVVQLTSSLQEVEQKYSQEVVFHSDDIQAVAKLKEKLSSVSGELDALMTEKTSAEAALAAHKEQWAQEQRGLKEEVSRLQERLSELEAQNAVLHDQLEALSLRIPAHKPQGDDAGDATPAKSADSSLVEDEINSPEQLLQIIKFLRKEKNVIACKLSVARSENARIKVQLESAEKQLKEYQLKLSSDQEKVDVSATAAAKHSELLRKTEMLYAVTDSNRILREERESLAAQVKELTEKYEAVVKELEPLKESSKELTVKVDVMTAENLALRAEAARLRQRNNFLVERTSKSNQEDLRRLQQERDSLSKQLAAEKEQHQRLQDEIRVLRQEKARLEEQAKAAQQQRTDEVRKLNEEMSAAQQQATRLKQELNDSKNEYTKKNDELAILTEELGAKEAMLNEIRSKEMTIRKIAKKYKAQYEEQIKSLEDNKKKLEELQVAAVAADSLAAESTSSLEIPEEAQERLRAEGRQNMEEKIKEVEEQHTAAMKELSDQVSSSQSENESLRKENDLLKNSAQEKEEQTKKVLKNARDKIVLLTETTKNLTETNKSLVESNRELKEKNASLTQKLSEIQKKIETLENKPEEANTSFKAQLESQISKLQKENADLKSEIQQNEEKYLRDSESYNQKISQLQRQLDKQQGSKPSTSSSMAEKPAVEPPTANIKPMAGPSSTASKQSQSQQSVTVAPWPGRGETPFASIRPMSMQSRMVAVLPTQTTSSSCQQSASQSMGTVLVAPQQLVHTTGPSDGPSSSPTSSHTEFMPATSSAGPAIRQAAVQPTQQVLVAPSASSSAESTQDMEAESVEEMQQPPQVQQQQAVALVLPRVEQTISSQCSEQSSIVTASPQQASSNNTVTTSQAGVKRPRDTESEGSSSRETDKLGPMMKRTRTVEGGSQQETVTSAEGSLEVEYQVPTSSQRDQEDDVPIVDSEEDEDGLADGGVVEEPDDGQEFEDDADNGEGFVVEGYEREEQELVDYDESEGPNIDNNTTEQDSNEVEVAAGEDSNEVPNQSSSVAAESDVGQSTGPEASSSEAQKSEEVSSHASQSILPVRARSVQPLARQQQQQLLLPQVYEDAGDDSIVPSTPTLFVPRRSDGFGEAVSSPQVPQGRFTFSETNQPPGRASSAQAGPESMDDVRMDLSHLEDAGTGRSVPTTPLQVSPQADVNAEVSQGTEGDSAPPSVSDDSNIPSNIPSILITQDLEEPADQDDVQATEVTDAEEQDAVEAHSLDQEDAEAADGGNGVSSEGEKLVAVEEAEGREAEASEMPSNSGMSQRSHQRGSGTARRSARSMFRNRGRNDRPTPIIWNEPGSTSSRGREQMARMSMMHARAAERGVVFPRGAPRARRVRGKPKTAFTNPYHMRF